MTEDDIRTLSDLNYREALREQSRRAGGAVVERDGMLLLAGAHTHPTMNTAIRVDPATPATEALRRAREFFGGLGHGYGFSIRADQPNEDLIEAAEAAGLIALMSPPAMVLESRGADKPLPEGVDVRLVENGQGVRDFAEVSARAWSTYGLPGEVPQSVFKHGASILAPHIIGAVAYRSGVPVACALVVLSHGIAGIYWVGTIEEARGLGLGDAVTRTVANQGFDRHARLVSLQASPMGHAIYRRMGFRRVFQYQMLICP